ncbi:hypothetical protein OSK51_30595, partial [Escherichia coli]|nr:hypothetical protein [Escherichia coli]
RADAYAMEIKAAFKEKGIQEFVDSYTNQQFVIVTDEQAEKLAKEQGAQYIIRTSQSGRFPVNGYLPAVRVVYLGEYGD